MQGVRPHRGCFTAITSAAPAILRSRVRGKVPLLSDAAAEWSKVLFSFYETNALEAEVWTHPRAEPCCPEVCGRPWVTDPP